MLPEGRVCWRHVTAERHNQHLVKWAEAAEYLRQLAADRRTAAHAVIAITGPVGAGKSTLAGRVSDLIVATDDYLPDYDLVHEHQRDLPDFADLPRLAADLAALREGRHAEIPTWSFHSHKREGYRRLIPPPNPGLIAVEGIHALHHRVLPATDLRVFVEAPSDLRWSRVEARERSGARGWGVDVAREFFHNVAEPTFSRLAPLYRAAADVVVLNE